MRLPAFINKHFNIHEKEIAIGSAYAFFYRILGLGFTYILIYIINEIFGTDAYGIFSICVSTLLFFSIIGSQGLNTSILRYVGQFNNPDEAGNLKLLYKQAIKIIWFITPILSVLLFVFSDLIAAELFHNIVYSKALKLTSFIAPVYTFLMISVEYLRGLKKLVFSELLRSVAVPFTCIILLLALKTYSNYILTPVIVYGIGVTLAASMATFLILSQLKRIKHTAVTAYLKLRDLLWVSWPMFICAIGIYIMDNLGLFLAQSFFDESTVGVYAIVLKFSVLITIILTGINTIAAPKIAELFWARNRPELKKTVKFSAKTSFYLSTPIFLILVFFPRTLLSIFNINEEYAAIMLIIIAIGQYINVLTGSVGVFLNMTGNQKINRNIVVISTFLTIVLSIYLIKIYGMIGLAIATAFGYILLNVTRAVYVYKKFEIKTFYLPFVSK